jgi:hypothetical protein
MTLTNLKPAAKLSRGRHSPIGFFEYRSTREANVASDWPLFLVPHAFQFTALGDK